MQFAGQTLLNNGTLSGNISLLAGTLSQAGSIVGTLQQTGGQFNVDNNSVALTGTFNQTGGITFIGGGGGGFLDMTGDYTISGGELFLGDGTGQLRITGGSFTIDAGGFVSGIGTITGSVSNAGVLKVGNRPFTPFFAGTLTIAGDYTQTGTLWLELDSDVSYDVLQISGTANLGGILQVDLLNPPTFPDLASYWVLSYSTRVGDFASVSLPTVSLYDWTITPGAVGYGLLLPPSE